MLIELLLGATMALAAHPTEKGKAYHVAGKSKISFKVPYSSGTHVGSATEISGKVTVDLEDPEHAKGLISMPILAMSTGNDKRDCHMREALGLEYAHSKYPSEHVCDESDKLPGSGPDSVVYPKIELKVESIEVMSGYKKLVANAPADVTVNGIFTVHGISHEVAIPMKLAPEQNGFRAKGNFEISLKDYKVVVKSAKVVFLTISVDDKVSIDLDLLFQI